MLLKTVLSTFSDMPAQRLALFALLTLGMIEALASGLLGATEALQSFFHTENCLFVRRHLRDKTADTIMSHGVQLPDLFETLPTEQAQREFQRELATMRALCLRLLEEKQVVA
jgi:hypothetical protein